MSEELKPATVHDANVFLPGSLGPVRRDVVLAYEHDRVVDQLHTELAALKAWQGEAVAWRDHSINYAKGDKCPATIETLQAAWDRDQELMLDQKAEISRLKETINQLRQRRTAPSATADAVSVPRNIALRMAADAAQYDHEHAVVNDNVQLWQQPNARVSLTVGDLRTVRALLAQSESEGLDP